MLVTPEPPIGDAPDRELPEQAAALFTILGRRWSLHLLYVLGHRPARFTQLQRAIPGLSATTLNDRLRDLVQAGLIERHTDPGPPLASAYEATTRGRIIASHLTQLTQALEPHT